MKSIFLDSDNAYTQFTVGGQLLWTLDGFPVGISVGGEVGIKVMVVESVAPAIATKTFTSLYDLATVDGTIPAGVLNWSITAVSGTVTVMGKSLPIGATTNGGDHPGYTLGTAVIYTITAGSAMINTDTPVA